MHRQATRLTVKLVALQAATLGVAGALVGAFAPRLLLLSPEVVAGSAPLLGWFTAAVVVFASLATLALGRRSRPALRALAIGNKVQAADVLALYALPARLLAADLAACTVLGGATLIAPVRPATNDLYTQGELVALGLTFFGVAVLPFYVLARTSVAHVLELVPGAVGREAIEGLEAKRGSVARVRGRFFAAVVAPVAFVAVAATLLVQAHVRAFDARARQADAVEVARGALEPIGYETAGREDATEAARLHGYQVQLSGQSTTFQVTRDDRGETEVTVPLDDGHAVVRFDTARISPKLGLLVLVAILGVLLAAALGMRIGAAYSSDLRLATRELRETGVIDVLRGLRIDRDARFVSVQALMGAIDGLGGVFREFAAAQERAIEARAATERMRGLFLASMSHDLKAPLNSILGFAELVSRNPLTEGQRESVAIIEQRGRELLHLIETILDSARAEAGALVVSPEWTMVGDVVMPAVLDARALTEGMNVEVVGEIQPGVPRVYVDPARATQAIVAVVLAAARFGEGSTVHVRATLPAAGERLRIDVETTGHGLSRDEREQVFDAFKHADRARQHGSLGLGPSLARALIELHGGSVDVETVERGGTVFHMWLPTERMSAQRLPPAPSWE